MKPIKFLTALWLSMIASIALADQPQVQLPTEKTVTAALAEAEKMADGDAKMALLESLNAEMDLLKQIQTQQQANQDLQKTLDGADAEIKKNSAELTALKKQLEESSNDDYQKEPLENLQDQLAKLNAQQQKMQDDVSAANAAVTSQNTASERAQTVLSDNLKRTQELNKLIAADSASNKVGQYQLELRLLELQNDYNQNLLKNDDQLTLLYQSRYNLLNAKGELRRKQVSALQEAVNQKNLEQSKNQVEQAQQQQQTATNNEYVQKELDANAELSKYLLEQTQKTNDLTQNELRIRGVLESLQQTKHSVEEQINALQGTLLLSRIIQQQKQNLPTDLNISGLAKQISDLRVRIFDSTQDRNELYNLDEYIAKIEKDEQQKFSDADKTQLHTLLSERRKVLSDLINTLNSQLNLSITLELSQQQITQMSDELQSKLEQQSFWVKSNDPLSFDVVKMFPIAAWQQITAAVKKLTFDVSKERLSFLPYLLGAAAVLLLLGVLILKFKNAIKHRLSVINGEVHTLRYDSQWHTPQALFLTALLSLPSVLWFMAACQLIGYFFFRNPMDFWDWALRMSVYWWFFAFLLGLLRPNGMISRHFELSKDKIDRARHLTRRIIVAVALQLNTSVFSAVAKNGLSSDVLGQGITMLSLIICLVIIAPLFNKNVTSYAKEHQNSGAQQGFLMLLVRVLLYAIPIGLIVLIGMGYYYTALVLIQHLIASYVAWVVWVIARQTIYRAITVSSRRLAYRRLLEEREKRQKENNDGTPSEDVVAITEQEQGLALNDVRSQLVSFADLFLWAVLFGIFYWVWSDLVTVASYLQGISLWTQTTTTTDGTITENITLFSVIVALVILTITYILIRNIAGILEVLVFSRVKLSQGTPYAITTLITYALIAIGGAWAFSTLGMSWSKLQWLFAALSVGLGFGMQEIFANFVSGIILLFERPIRVGDTVTINGTSGTVSKIRIRAISIIDYDRKEVIIPNKSFVTGEVTNWALSNTVTRLIITVGVAYGSDLDLVKRLLLQAADEEPNVLKDPAPRALFLTFGASTLDHELRVYVNDVGIRTETIDLLNRRVNKLFAENNIEIAFNQMDIFIKNQDNGEVMPLIDVNNPKQA